MSDSLVPLYRYRCGSQVPGVGVDGTLGALVAHVATPVERIRINRSVLVAFHRLARISDVPTWILIFLIFISGMCANSTADGLW